MIFFVGLSSKKRAFTNFPVFSTVTNKDKRLFMSVFLLSCIFKAIDRTNAISLCILRYPIGIFWFPVVKGIDRITCNVTSYFLFCRVKWLMAEFLYQCLQQWMMKQWNWRIVDMAFSFLISWTCTLQYYVFLLSRAIFLCLKPYYHLIWVSTMFETFLWSVNLAMIIRICGLCDFTNVSYLCDCKMCISHARVK